jgi:hypothetical protein
MSITDENSVFDARCHDLTLIVMIDRRVDFPSPTG